MSPLEMIRHNWLGSSKSESICFDYECFTSCGAKILHQEFHGYGEEGRDLTSQEEQKLKDSANEHLKKHPSHRVGIFIGHHDSIMDEETGYSKVVYEYHAPWSKKM